LAGIEAHQGKIGDSVPGMSVGRKLSIGHQQLNVLLGLFCFHPLCVSNRTPFLSSFPDHRSITMILDLFHPKS
jgi:hypothetical protein